MEHIRNDVNGWDFTPTILTATDFYVLLVSRESRSGDSMSHDSNSFSRMVQINNNFIPAQTSPGSAQRAVSLGCTDEKWATEAKQRRRWNTQNNKEVMTCYVMSKPSERVP